MGHLSIPYHLKIATWNKKKMEKTIKIAFKKIISPHKVISCWKQANGQ